MASKVVIVTGASRGIGLAVATYLLKAPESHKLVLVSRSEQELQQIKSSFPSQVVYLAIDLTTPEVCMHLGSDHFVVDSVHAHLME